MDYEMISQLKPGKGSFKIKVRITGIWESTNPYLYHELFSLDIIMVDEKATAIEGTIKAPDASYFKALLKEGNVYHISNFIVAPNKQKFRVVQHALILRFTRMTSFKKIENIIEIPAHVFSFVNFHELSDRTRDDVILTDMIGHIVCVGPLEDKYIKERITKMRNLEIEDPSGNQIQITLWGQLAEGFPADMILGQKKAIIIIFAGMTVRIYQGRLCLYSCSASRYYLDLPIPEVLELKPRLITFPGATALYTQELKSNLSPDDEANDNKKTVSELQFLVLADHQNTQVSCEATMKDIDVSEGWWYRACPRCKIGVRVFENTYWCDKCFSVQDSPLTWYKLIATVEDGSGQINFIMFEKIVADMVGISAAALTSNPQYRDRFILPPVLRNLLGKTYIFRVSVESRESRKKSALKVMRILKEIDTNTFATRNHEASSSAALVTQIKQEPFDDASDQESEEIMLKGKRKVAKDILEDENPTYSGEKKIKK